MAVGLEAINGELYTNGKKMLYQEGSTQLPSDGAWSHRNKLINGGFDIWQRGTTIVVAGFSADRWRAGSATSQDRVDATGTGHLYGLKITNVGGNANTGQPIELPKTGDTTMFPLGSTWTVSFWAKGLAGGDLTCKMLGRDASGSTVNEVTLVDGSQVGVLTTAWQKFVITMTTTADIGATNTCMHMLFGSPDEFSIAGVQLEEGSVATPFEVRPIGLELSLCQRYYQAMGTARLLTYVADASARRYASSMAVPMRVAPTVSYTYTSGGGGTHSSQSTSQLWSFVSTGVATTNEAYVSNVSADAEL